MAAAVLRHRIVLNYNAESEGQTSETVIRKLVDSLAMHESPAVEKARVERILK